MVELVDIPLSGDTPVSGDPSCLNKREEHAILGEILEYCTVCCGIDLSVWCRAFSIGILDCSLVLQPGFLYRTPKHNTCVYRGTDFRNRISLVIFEILTKMLLKYCGLWRLMGWWIDAGVPKGHNVTSSGLSSPRTVAVLYGGFSCFMCCLFKKGHQRKTALEIRFWNAYQFFFLS